MLPTATPTWAIAPFLVYLVSIAALPLFAGRFWEHNRNKLLVAALVSAPVIAFLLHGDAGTGARMLLHTACDYAAFIALLGALFTISGGICLSGSLVGTPLVNTTVLAIGSLLGSVVGTTGASVLLIRPLLRANARRAYSTHIVVFFIFIVSNAAGLLTPLGDPPLFLGFLRGVPFTWTLRLAAPWAVVNGVLLALFATIDRTLSARERRRLGVMVSDGPAVIEPLKLEGAINLVWLMGIVLVVFVMGSYGTRLFGDGLLRDGVQVAGMIACAALSLATTPKQVHETNRFNWAPIIEVAAVFVGVFITMIPALSYLGERGASLGVTKPWQFFWAAGALSSVLDNAPTYLTFASLALGVAGGPGGLSPSASLGALAAHPTGAQLLAAVSCGAVMMGAVTYIGNGPNFMVKAIAEQHHVRTPSFFGYVAWSGAILLPLFALVAHLFF